jgi:hypothetical protein
MKSKHEEFPELTHQAKCVTEQPATEAPAAADALALVAPTTVITQYEVLIDDIKEARAKAAEMAFDLTDKKGIAAAKSYVFSLRKLNGRIDDAHMKAKVETLERGRAIDRVKNVLREQVAALIQPHQDALDAIAKAEAERVAKHRLWITTVQDLARVPFGSDSEGIKEMMLKLELYEQSVDLLEEFILEGKAALVDTVRALKEAHAKAVANEASAAELARLREEARLQAEEDAAAKAAKDAGDAAAEVALDAEAVAHALQGEALLEIKPAELPAAVASDYAKLKLRRELSTTLTGKTRLEVVDSLIDGTLHHAIKIDWAAMGAILPTT